MEQYHNPVMAKETLSYITAAPRKVVADCTLGDGGHSIEILNKTSAYLIGMDVDEQALRTATKRLRSVYRGRCSLINWDYRELPMLMAKTGIPRSDCFLYDLGVSSRQLDDPQRGFSFKYDGPLDMRMNMANELTARDIVMNYDEESLERIIGEYGEERFSKRIARGIIKARDRRLINTGAQLTEVILSSIPGKARHGRLHPARRTFQALRIEVNNEISALENAFKQGFSLLNPGGVMIIISYHSLEDRIAKRFFIEMERLGKGKRLTKKPIRPSDKEISVNPRAKSAKLRAAEKNNP